MAGIKCVLNVPLLRVIKPGFKDDVPSSLTLPPPHPPIPRGGIPTYPTYPTIRSLYTNNSP